MGTRWKLSEDEVVRILKMKEQGYSDRIVAHRFGIHRSYVSKLAKKRLDISGRDVK